MAQKIKAMLERMKNGDTKSKALAKNIILSFGVKGLAVLVALVNMPIFMDYFEDSSVLGVWFTLLSMLNWVLMFDLGIGNGLRNYLVIALEKKDTDECKRLIASAYCSVSTLVVVLSVVAYFLIPQVNWNSVCNISTQLISAGTLTTVIRMLAIGILLQFLLKLITSILYAMQQSAIPNFLLLSSNVLLLLSTFILNTGDPQRNLIRLSMAYVLTANLPMLIATVYVFVKPLRGIGIHINYWSRKETAQIIGLGIGFLTLQLLSMATFNTREFYIMRFIGPNEVVPYQVYHKLFSLVSTFFVLAMTPMWSAITQAAAQHDDCWIKRLYSKIVKAFFLFAFGSVLVVLSSQLLVNIWLQEKSIEMNLLYGFAFAIYNIEYMWISLHSQFENGLKRLRAQKWGYSISTIALPILSWFFSKLTGNWIMVVVSSIIALLPICLFQYFNMKKCFQDNITGIENTCE